MSLLPYIADNTNPEVLLDNVRQVSELNQSIFSEMKKTCSENGHRRNEDPAYDEGGVQRWCSIHGQNE